MANKLALMLGKSSSNQPKKETTNEPETKQESGRDGEPQASAAPAKKPGLAGLKIAKVPGTPSKPAVRGGAGAADGNAEGTQAESKELTLDDLENDESPGTHRPGLSQFTDEVPATQPIRDIAAATEGMSDDESKAMRQFADLADGVYSILDDPEMLGNVIRSIMIELKTYPQYMKLVAPEDVRTWIRAMRENMGLQKIKKEAKKTSRSGGSKKSVDLDMLSDLENMDLGDI